MLGRDQVSEQPYPVGIAHRAWIRRYRSTVEGKVYGSDVEPALSDQRCQRPEGTAMAARAVDDQNPDGRLAATGPGDVNAVAVPLPPGLFRVTLSSGASPGWEEGGI